MLAAFSHWGGSLAMTPVMDHLIAPAVSMPCFLLRV
jgi:hypothetical protein